MMSDSKFRSAFCGALAVSLIFIATGCATRTTYQAHSTNGGYSQTQIDENLYVARFVGNALTNANDAQIFSAFRATEICHEQGKGFARIHGIQDLSTQKNVLRSSSHQYQAPTYFSGSGTSNSTYNYFGNGFGTSQSQTNVSGTVYGGQQYGGTTTWTETYNYPTYDTYFSCHDRTFMTGVGLQAVSKEEMKPYVSDLLGALQVTGTMEGSPNEGRVIKGDFVIKVNGRRVENVVEYSRAVDSAKSKNSIPVLIVREGKNRTIKLKAVDASEQFKQQQAQIVQSACSVRETRTRAICSGRVIADGPVDESRN